MAELKVIFLISCFPIGTIPKFPIWMTLVYAFMTTKGIHKWLLQWILRKRSWCVVDCLADLWVCLFPFLIFSSPAVCEYILLWYQIFYFIFSIAFQYFCAHPFPALCALCTVCQLFTANWVVKIFFFNFENYLLTWKVISHLWQMATMLPPQRNSIARAYLSK